jgi:small ubiquitin-related modifier
MSDKSEDSINIRAVDQNGSEVYFKVKKNTKMEKIFNAYHVRSGSSPSSIRFLFDGKRIASSSTAKELEMEDGDIIDVVVAQTGGNYI